MLKLIQIEIEILIRFFKIRMNGIHSIMMFQLYLDLHQANSYAHRNAVALGLSLSLLMIVISSKRVPMGCTLDFTGSLLDTCRSSRMQWWPLPMNLNHANVSPTKG